ncbi:MAG: cell envelope integrity protein CreD [candidate division WS1 bacterium]|nr:cell envelope integrity protein CreD [candidate division WS1 bacterium]
MRSGQIAGLVFVYILISLAWAILGSSVTVRTENSFKELREQVAGLWGSPMKQRAPDLQVQETVSYTDGKGNRQTRTESTALVPDSSDVKVSLQSDARRKGLLWYRTYAVEFDATYTVSHSATRKPVLVTTFHFPSSEALYDEFLFSVNGERATVGAQAPLVPSGSSDKSKPSEPGLPAGKLTKTFSLPPGKTATIKVHYKSRGLDSWAYEFGPGVTEVRHFKLAATTDFQRVDFPARSISPSEKRLAGTGWELIWQFKDLITGFQVGVEAPQELNPGTLVSRISFFAPVGLLFFIAVLVIVGLRWGKSLHPMHYLFVGGGFFSFHLLMAYLADHLDLKLTFLICALVSVALVVSYLIRAAGASFALKVAAPAQLVYLILFSYTFFFTGYTGLSLTVGAIVTLAILMQVTAKVDWERLQPVRSAPAPPPPPPG